MSDHDVLFDRIDAVERLLRLHAEETRTRLDLLTSKVLSAIERWDDKLDMVADDLRKLEHRVTALEAARTRGKR